MRRLICLLLSASAALAADAIYVNGTVITVDPAHPYAEAFAVTNGRFSAIGTNSEIRRLATPATVVVDLKGMTVTPGFDDVHLHPVGVYDESSPYYTPWLGPEKVHNMDELVAALKAKADRTPAGQMVSGSRYQDTKARPASQSPRSRQSLHNPPHYDQPLVRPYRGGQLLYPRKVRHHERHQRSARRFV